MKNFLTITVLLFSIVIYSQEIKANRFYYDLTYHPDKQDSIKIENTIAILDIIEEKSIYRDYVMVSQDSILKVKVERIKKSGGFKELEKLINIPKFSYKVVKYYPSFNIEYIDGIEQQLFSYNEKIDLKWVISSQKDKIGEYNVQKATTKFGGREWVAWFSSEIPFNDGPYKFNGLPGLIIKISDTNNNYTWILKGNKKIENYNEISYTEKLYYAGNIKPINISKDKFRISFENYKKDPLAVYKTKISQDLLNSKMPGSETTYKDRLKVQEEALKKFLNSNNNPIEIKD